MESSKKNPRFPSKQQTCFFSLSLFFFTRTSFHMNKKTTYTDTEMPSSYALRNSRALDAAAACERAKAWAQRRKERRQEEAGRIENWLISSPAKKKKTVLEPAPDEFDPSCDEDEEDKKQEVLAGQVVAEDVVHARRVDTTLPILNKWMQRAEQRLEELGGNVDTRRERLEHLLEVEHAKLQHATQEQNDCLLKIELIENELNKDE